MKTIRDAATEATASKRPTAAIARRAVCFLLFFPMATSAQFGPQTDLADLRKAAEGGVSSAQLNLGFRYAEGKDVPQDFVEAAKWYRKAADQGDALAQLNMGYVYAEGHGVAQDRVEALKWSRKAADQGSAAAQFMTGALYIGGLGVPQDFVEAAKWYRKGVRRSSGLPRRVI